MALPTAAEVQTMDYPSRGGPFVDVVAKTGIDSGTMDYPSRGMAYVVNAFGSVASEAGNDWPTFQNRGFWSWRY